MKDKKVNKKTKPKIKYKLGPDVDLDVDIILDNDGVRITEARAAKMAEEALESYYAWLQKIEEQEDLEDIAAVDEAMLDKSPGIPWEQVQKNLGLGPYSLSFRQKVLRFFKQRFR